MDVGRRVDEVEWEEEAGKRWKKRKRDIGSEALIAGNLGRVMGRDSGAAGSPAALHLQAAATSPSRSRCRCRCMGLFRWYKCSSAGHSALPPCGVPRQPQAQGDRGCLLSGSGGSET